MKKSIKSEIEQYVKEKRELREKKAMEKLSTFNVIIAMLTMAGGAILNNTTFVLFGFGFAWIAFENRKSD